MPRVLGTTAGLKKHLITPPTDGLPNSEWVGAITIQRDELATDNATPSTGYILICLPGRHNSNAGGADLTPTTAVRDVVLSAAQPSYTHSLETGDSANSLVPISQITWTNTVDNEGVTFSTLES